jgi:DNA-binding response OmpR family regulator
VTEHISNGVFVVDGVAGARPDLLILDVGLPGLNGIDVFDLVRGSDRWGDLPVLFVTAAPERTREAIASGGLRDVMAKPFDIDALVTRVEAMLASTAQAA